MRLRPEVPLIFFIVLATAVTGYVVTYDGAEDAPLLGREKCTYGPSYWCHNLTQASSCSAVQHCISRVWENLRLPADNDSVCETCKEMVKEARDQLLSNETQDELRQVLEGSCALIPLKVIAKECSHMMDQFLPELVDALASRMDPQVVCAVSGLCNSARIDRMLEAEAPPPPKPFRLTCGTCTNYMSRLFRYLKKDEETLQAALLEECGHLGSYSDSCRKAVLEEFDGIKKALENADALALCELIGICNEVDGDDPAMEPPPKEDMECDFCKQLVGRMKTWMTENTTKEEFTQVVKGLCKAAKNYESQCVQFFEQYGGEVYQLILDDLDPESFCQRIGVCQGPGKVNEQPRPIWTILKPEDTLPMAALLPGEQITGQDEVNAIRQQTQPTSKETCEFCELVVTRVQNYIEDPTTENSVEKFVENLCSKHLPKEVAEQCDEFVTEYGEQLIELIATEVDPNEICSRLRVCPKKKQLLTSGVGDFLPTCAICTFTVQKLVDLIGQNKTAESIERAMDGVCHMLPKKYLDGCEDFMKNYGDRVVEMILIDGTAHEICATLHLCLFLTNQPVLPPLQQVPAVGNDEPSAGDDPKCVMCEYVISTLAERIRDNATEEEIKNEVESICTHLPKTVTHKCKEFVDNYGDTIIAFLIQEMDPEQVCTELKLCKPQQQGGLKLTPCSLCTIIRDYFEVKMSDPKFAKNAVELGIRRLCPNLKNFRGQCKAMIEDYGPYMIRLIQQDEEDVCGILEIC